MAVFLEKLSALHSCIQPGLLTVKTVVEHCEHPDFAALKPDEFVRVIDATVPVKAGEIAPELLILGFLEPEREHILEEFLFILERQLFKVHFRHINI